MAPKSHLRGEWQPEYTSGQVIPCRVCSHGITAVAPQSVATVRAITRWTDAVPGSTVHRCRNCKTLTEVRCEPAQGRAA